MSRIFSAKLSGMSAVAKALRKAEKDGVEAFGAGLYQMGFKIMAESKRRVPVDIGILRGTGYVAPPKGKTRKDIFVELGYGTKYALPVHAKHKTKSNYLRGPVDDARGSFTRELARFVVRNLKRGIGVQSVPPEHPKSPKGGGK